MPGRFGRTMPARGWPNLVEIAGAALRHYDEICDPAYHYAPYVGASIGWPTPCFNHHRWDWIEVLPYPLIGRIAARRITGYLGGAEIERRQRQLLLSAFHNLDGFAYPHYVRGWSERTRLCLWEQGRVMFALLAWFEESQDERVLAYVRGIVAGPDAHQPPRGRPPRHRCPARHRRGLLGPVAGVDGGVPDQVRGADRRPGCAGALRRDRPLAAAAGNRLHGLVAPAERLAARVRGGDLRPHPLRRARAGRPAPGAGGGAVPDGCCR